MLDLFNMPRDVFPWITTASYARPICLMSSEISPHLLATPLHRLGHFGYPIEDNIAIYLDTLYKGRLYEVLAEGYPGAEIIRNLADAYADISALIFWGKDNSYDEALRAFPLFIKHLSQTAMELSDLHNLYRISCNFRDGLPGGDGPPHLSHLENAVETISEIVCSEPYRSTIDKALHDKARADYDDVIDLAVWFNGVDEFELHFNYARFDPVRGLRDAYWFIGMDDAQCRRFMDWARRCISPGRRTRLVSRSYTYAEPNAAILTRVLDYPSETLRNLRDRHDIAVWGLSSSDAHLASKAALLLEQIPVSKWPDGSCAVIKELLEEVEQQKTKDRLQTLIDQRCP